VIGSIVGRPARAIGKRAEDLALGGLDVVLSSRLAEEAVDRVLASSLAKRALARTLQGPLVDDVLASPAIERMIARVLDSRELWVAVDEIAQSPAVTEAITRQSVSFADQVAGRVRDGSRNADARLERAARRALRRAPPK
jgi:hypothetical protein